MIRYEAAIPQNLDGSRGTSVKSFCDQEMTLRLVVVRGRPSPRRGRKYRRDQDMVVKSDVGSNALLGQPRCGDNLVRIDLVRPGSAHSTVPSNAHKRFLHQTPVNHQF